MIAHGLTALRLVLIVPLVLGFVRPDWVTPFWLLVTLAVAIASDVLDGIVARRRGTASAFGQLFDHGTDCAFVVAGLAAAAHVGLLNPWLPWLVAIAFAQYVLDSHFLHGRRRLRVSQLGRVNGILYFAPLVGLALAAQPVLAPLALLLYGGSAGLAWVLVATTLVSIGDRALAPWLNGA